MIYSSVIQSKNGDAIPLFADGKPMHSKYNPSAERLPVDAAVQEGFFLIGGIGGGYHIANLVRQLKNYCIIAFEADRESLDFCMALKSVRELSRNPSIVFCQADDVQELLGQKYIASLYGDFTCLFQRAWQQENEKLCRTMEEGLQETLKAVSADFSVQSHFGKIWMHNILLNLRDFAPAREPLLNPGELAKCAAIIAAGPTLDDSARVLRERQEDFFIIATDTTCGPLYRRGIVPDAIVCVDAQQVSSEHFFPLPAAREGSRTPLVFLDLCSSPSCARLLRHRGIQPVFFHSGHPLSQRAAEACGLMQVETGSGTVTVAAADIARQLGFTRLRFFGADFSYSAGKPYVKGSYLDARFHSWSCALQTAEQQFAGLMYRTPLRHVRNGVYTSEVLEGYRKSLEAWQAKYGYEEKQDELSCKLSRKNAEKRRGNVNLPFNFKAFMEKSVRDIGQIADSSALYNAKAFYALLPYTAYLRKHADLLGNVNAKDSLELLRAACGYLHRFAD